MILHINNFRDLTVKYLIEKTEAELTPQILFEQLKLLSSIKSELCDAIRTEIFNNMQDVVIERHIHQVQQECIALMDQIDLVECSDETTETLGAAISTSLDEILGLIEKRYLRFFDPGVLAPIRHLRIRRANLLSQMNRLKASFKKRSISAELQHLIITCFAEFCNAESGSYSRLTYLSDLQGDIISLLEPQAEGSYNLRLLYFLVFSRFNYAPFVSHFKGIISKDLAAQYDSREQMEMLSQHEKQLISQGEIYQKGYVPMEASAKQVLLDFLKAEIRYINRQRKHIPGNSILASDNPAITERIRINLSVDAMIYLVRLFVEANVIIAQPRSKLIALIAKYIETPGTSNKSIAVYSASKKYDQVVQSTAKAARSVLMRMLRLLESQFDFKD